MIAPGATIGIIGGGQLGRMLSVAAAQLGYRCHIYSPESSGPAADVAACWVQGGYDDRAALAAFADAVDVCTYEFESIAADPLEAVAARVPLWPPLAALRIAQDRIAEKTFVAQHGARTTRWASVPDHAALGRAIAEVGCPAILKTTRFGYDGKGQARIASPADADSAWAALGGAPAILEAVVAFDHEFSVIVAQGADGSSVTWDVPVNVHCDGILATSTLPPPAAVLAQAQAARALAVRLVAALGYVGVLTIEFFAGRDGPVVNELAPRVHNSGHWTIEGAVTSQFENHIRAIAGLPLGITDVTGERVVMHNLIGDEIDAVPRWLATPGAHVHLYGKHDAKPGRKMGHVTVVGASGTDAPRNSSALDWDAVPSRPEGIGDDR